MKAYRTALNFAIILIIMHTGSLYAQSIRPLGNGLTMPGTVFDHYVDDDKLYIVGNLTGIGETTMDQVGYLESGTWHRVPDISEIDGFVFCVTVHNGELYIGGRFTIQAETSITNLAKLENGTWVDMGVLPPMDASIRDMVWFEDELYVTGDFRGISGVRSNGLMKYANGQWQDAGLNSFLNAKGIYVKQDTLLVYGSGFGGSGITDQPVSYYTGGEWTILPQIEADPGLVLSSLIYEGQIYATHNNSLYSYNENQDTWVKILDAPVDQTLGQLTEHGGELYMVYDDRGIYKVTNTGLEDLTIDISKSHFEAAINLLSSWNGDLMIGGDFVDSGSSSVSLSSVSGGSLRSLGTVHSNTSNKNAWNYSIGYSIVKYNGQYLIAGRFTFADGIYSPNLVYWDGDEFSPFEQTLPDGIRQLELFEGELYALPWAHNWLEPHLANFDLIKFDGTQWVGVDTPERFDDIIVINDKLFINDDFGFHFFDGQGPFYLQNGSWNRLNGLQDLALGTLLSNVRPYQGGYLMLSDHFQEGNRILHLPDESSQWLTLHTIDETLDFDLVTVADDRIFLTSDFREKVYEFKNDSIHLLSSTAESNLPVFFNLGGSTYFSGWNGDTRRIGDSDTLEYYNHLRIRDVEKISNDEYLIAMNNRSYSNGLSNVDLHNIGIWSFADLEVDLLQDKQEICDGHFAQLWPHTDNLNLDYEWHFPGGIPEQATTIYPMVKYDNPGNYLATLRASNQDGDTLIRTTQISVKSCAEVTQRAANHDNHWIMSYEYLRERGGIGGFDFSLQDSVIASRYFGTEMHNGSTIMSDSDGKLQFYSNGISIMNMHNEPIAGSECFNADLSDYPLDYFIMNQSILSLPIEGRDNVYHLLDMDPLQLDNHFYTSASNLSITTVDMNANEGRGEIIDCNSLIIQDTLLNSTMQATRHQNGIDWWVIVGKFESDIYYKVLLSTSGVKSVEQGRWQHIYDEPFTGQSTFSPDGQYFAQVIRENQEISLYRFDNQTGELYDPKSYHILTIDGTEYPQGCSFSPDSRFLYVSSLTQLRQLDLCDYDNNIEAELIDSWDGTYEFIFPLFFAKQMLSPNQEIIVTPYGNGHTSFGVIKSPNKKGTACDFRQHDLRLHESTRNSADVLPIFPHFRNYASHNGDCSNNTVAVENEESSSEFYIFPNPVRSTSTIHFSKSTSGQLYDLNGRLLSSFSSVDYLDVMRLAAGTYILITDAGARKLIVL